jgi:DNA polymerase-3 subunit epsilon
MIGLAFDTETTGIPYKEIPLNHPDQPRMVQIGCILFDENGHEIEVLDSLIYPDGWSVDYDSEMVHGWTTEDCAFLGQPAIDVLNHFSSISKKADFIIAHNIDFDITILEIESAHHNFDLTIPDSKKFCTMKNSASIVGIPFSTGGYKFPSLPEAYKAVLGKDLSEEDLHEALSDARMAKDLYIAMTALDSSGLPTPS